jgi:hypothetical protein
MMNIDMNQSIRPSDIEFMTTYPKMGGRPEEKVLLIVGRTVEGYRYLVYAPTVVLRDVEMEQDVGYTEYYGGKHNTLLGSIPTSRKITLNNEMYVLPNDNDTFFNLIFLDKQPALHVKKGDIEKLFGCVIDG